MIFVWKLAETRLPPGCEHESRYWTGECSTASIATQHPRQASATRRMRILLRVRRVGQQKVSSLPAVVRIAEHQLSFSAIMLDGLGMNLSSPNSP